MNSLFSPSTGLIKASQFWFYAKDGDEFCRAVFQRHYSFRRYKDGRRQNLFVGPGEKVVLLTANGDALFIWRKFKSGDGQRGINCAAFRNESDTLSSALILDAESVAARRWPGERLFTYVNPRRIKSSNPGYCFKLAGWNACGVTKWNRLTILEKIPK